MLARMSSVAVYCASSPGVDPGYAAATAALGRTLAERQIRLVYGGSHTGLMGVLADECLAQGGEVHGVITRSLVDKEIAHRGLTSLEVVETMHERKARMSGQADGFIMLPGGFGTLDEFFEAVTWTQLGIHAKPCGVLDVDGFFAPLRALLEEATRQRFLRQEHRELVIMESDPDRMLSRLCAWEPVVIDKWLDRA